MSVDALSATQPLEVPQVRTPSATPNVAKGANSSQPMSNAEKAIANRVTIINANGTITVTTAYTDGTTSSATNPNPPTPVVSQSPLTATSGQLGTLLQAQQQAR